MVSTLLSNLSRKDFWSVSVCLTTLIHHELSQHCYLEGKWSRLRLQWLPQVGGTLAFSKD